jgi:hypothetical protein
MPYNQNTNQSKAVLQSNSSNSPRLKPACPNNRARLPAVVLVAKKDSVITAVHATPADGFQTCQRELLANFGAKSPSAYPFTMHGVVPKRRAQTRDIDKNRQPRSRRAVLS